MAKSDAVWGIDIGQCAVKALRCRPGDDQHITADAFDYIEYSKILSQPDADPVELVREALQTFLSRNKVRGDKVAISVSGQSGLARFIKLPPVESKKIPDIVKYEARQQIPFALEDVVWDYQRMAGGSEEEGFALETEVGLFAMKRDQVFRALKPFNEAGIEVDIIQLTPLAIYNYTVFDQMHDLPGAELYDPEDPPESVVVLSLGTDTTDLVITNGYRVWQRSVPLGGSHFTKALTKELRLTFAKAEHMKRNATTAADPKAIFQAMRPVFNDLLTEVQRSIGYFSSIDRSAKIGRVIALGNAMKLPGLQKYLSQNLGYPVAEVDSYRGLTGSGVVGSPAFKENLLSFAVCYGLAIQGLRHSKLSTNLIPREIVTDRKIREKKPWAVAAIAVVMLGFLLSFLGDWRAVRSVWPDLFKQHMAQADSVESASSGFIQEFEDGKTKFKTVDDIGKNIVGNVEGRILWLELMQAITSSLPQAQLEPDEKRPDDISQRNEIHITEMEVEYFPNLATWYAGVADRIREAKGIAKAAAGADPTAASAAPAAAPPATAVPPAAAPPAASPPATTPPAGAAAAAPAADAGGEPVAEGPNGKGWVVQLTGYHYHNQGQENVGPQYVRETLLKNLETGTVELPVGPKGEMKAVAIKDLGVDYPVLLTTPRIVEVEIPDSNADLDENNGVAQGPKMLKLMRFDFVLQFSWQETPPSVRIQKAQAKAKAAADAQATTAPTDAGAQ